MKKIVLTLVVAASFSFAQAKPLVNEKVLKVFSRVFPGVDGARWYDAGTNYEACFESEGIKCRARFDADGKLLSTIRYYGEKNLSPVLKARLAERFPGKTIFGVTEVNSESELSYNIVLEDAKTWTNVKADAFGQTEVVESFKKA